MKTDIQSVLDSFDFWKVRHHMEDVGWVWATEILPNNKGFVTRTPSVNEMIETARGLLLEAERLNNVVATGGFVAEKTSEGLSLIFEFKDKHYKAKELVDKYKEIYER